MTIAVFNQPIEQIFGLIWFFNSLLMLAGLFIASIVFVLAKFKNCSSRIFPVLSISLVTLSTFGYAWLASPIRDHFVYEQSANVEVKQRSKDALSDDVLSSISEFLIPETEHFYRQSPVIGAAAAALQDLENYRIWRRLYRHLAPRISYWPDYSATYQIILDSKLPKKFAIPTSQSKLKGVPSDKKNGFRPEILTVTLSSQIVVKGVPADWPQKPFSVECESQNGKLMPVRPLSNWIFDVNLKEHITLTLPQQCTLDSGLRIKLMLAGEEFFNKSIVTVRGLYLKNDVPERTSKLAAYIQPSSVKPGDFLDMKISAANSVSIEISRLGAENKKLLQEKIVAKGQPIQAMSFRDDNNWSVSHSIKIAETWRPGYYVAKITEVKSNQPFYLYFLVSHHQTHRLPPQIAILASTNTWQAYNSWGGGSFYWLDYAKETAERQSHLVNLARPINADSPNKSGLVQSEIQIARWMERNGYDFTAYTDIDLHSNLNLLSKHKLLVIPTHSEYWTDEMVQALELHLANGGSVAYLGGNAIYQRVSIKGNLMEGYNHRQFHQQDAKLGGFYYLLGRPQASILGVQYDSVGYNTYAPYLVKAPEHWIFEGTGLKNGDQFGIGKLGSAQLFASGHETDKMTGSTPSGTVLLASGANPGKGADMTLYAHRGGGMVYSVGSIAYSGTLNLDRVQARVLSNFISKAGIQRSKKLGN